MRDRLARSYARWVIRWRWVVAAFWVVVVAGTTLWLPAFGEGGDQLASMIPLDSPAIRAELQSIEDFGFPLSSRTVVVQRSASGLSPYTQAESVLDGLAVNQQQQEHPLLGAIPLANTGGLFPSSREQGTTVLTYLFMAPTSGFADQQQAAQRYIDTHLNTPEDHTVGVAGSVPARAQQAAIVTAWLPVLEIATLIAVIFLVALTFRAVLPPLVAMVTAGVAFMITLRLAGLLGTIIGVGVPAELEPLLVALLLGVVTDYTIFYLSAYRRRLSEITDTKQALEDSVASFTPIILVAGLTVAAGTAALLAAQSSFFRAFGPAMAFSILTALFVSITLIPALMAILGPRLFWPRPPSVEAAYVRTPLGLRDVQSFLPHRRHEGKLIGLLMTRRVAAAALAVSAGALVVLALPLAHMNLGLGFTQSLPASNPVKNATAEAASGFAPGITSPTTILIEGPGVTRQTKALRQMQRAIEFHPGVAGVFGPANNLTPRSLGVVLAATGDAARYLVIFDHDPLGATSIDDLTALTSDLTTLAVQSGLRNVEILVAGDTALAEGLVRATGSDLVRIAIAALVINLLLLVIFLRALVAPLYLLASSVLSLCAALGLTTFVFQDLLGGDGITFYVPFAAAVLLVSLGSDYNIFGVGHVVERVKSLPLTDAIRVAVPESARAITAAGITLAVSFGLLAVIPLRSFYELGFAMAVGIMLDAVVIRSVVTPCLLVLVGPFSGWPGSSFGPRFARAR